MIKYAAVNKLANAVSDYIAAEHVHANIAAMARDVAFEKQAQLLERLGLVSPKPTIPPQLVSNDALLTALGALGLGGLGYGLYNYLSSPAAAAEAERTSFADYVPSTGIGQALYDEASRNRADMSLDPGLDIPQMPNIPNLSLRGRW